MDAEALVDTLLDMLAKAETSDVYDPRTLGETLGDVKAKPVDETLADRI